MRDRCIAFIIAVGMAGCASETANVEGTWDLTLSVLETSSDNSSGDSGFEGTLYLRQTFNQLKGDGYVTGVGGPACELSFDIEGVVNDIYEIPVKFDFTESTCTQELFESDILLTLQLTDEDGVLYGHTEYDDVKVYASARRRLYD